MRFHGKASLHHVGRCCMDYKFPLWICPTSFIVILYQTLLIVSIKPDPLVHFIYANINIKCNDIGMIASYHSQKA